MSYTLKTYHKLIISLFSPVEKSAYIQSSLLPCTVALSDCSDLPAVEPILQYRLNLRRATVTRKSTDDSIERKHPSGMVGLVGDARISHGRMVACCFESG